MDIKHQIRTFIADRMLMAGGADALADDASLLEQNVLDSTGVLELVAFLEDTYGLKVGDTEIVPENLDSLDRIATFVERKRGSK
jgi:acyl carrier protein